MVKRKSSEERASESFFRPNVDFRRTTEKPVKEGETREEILRYTTEKMVKD